ncbi:MAG TPA: energy-coupling factor transporter ATPase [Oscillospiraceae bacterium]|nr:energy-coupling factor transporter ATPase [Oscillospiraceae bacterium]HNW03768.1 energy-coupling factor transporter ATPase [Oscillospiraceae bacterium]
MSEIIRTENLSYTYSAGMPFESAALDHVSVSVEEGTFLGLIGHTGSGKSTLIQHLNGLLKPDSGKVYIGGEDIWKEPKNIRRFRFKVGLVFQYPEYQLFEETVRKDIAFGPRNMGLSEPEIEERVLEAAQLVGLPEQYLEKSPFELSGGEKRRAAIAGVLAMRPEVLILDEPTAGLDPRGRERILGEIAEYHDRYRATIILVSHSMEDVARFADHVLILDHGRAVLYGTAREIFGRVEELEGMGLEVPQISRVFAGLAKLGIPVPESVLTVAEAKEAVLGLLREGGGV